MINNLTRWRQPPLHPKLCLLLSDRGGRLAGCSLGNCQRFVLDEAHTCEVQCIRQVDEGKVVVQVELAPARVGEEVCGDNLGKEFQGNLTQVTSTLPSSVFSLTLCAPNMILMEEAPLAQWAAVSTHL